MLTERFLMGRGRDRMSEADKQALEDAIGSVRTLPPRHQIVRAGERVEKSTYLIDGFMCRYMDARDGQRQLVGIHVPGDFVDLHSFPMHRLDHDVGTLGPARVALFDHSTLVELTDARPHLTRTLWFATLLDAAMLREWIFRLGRLDAEGRVAHLMCELNARMEMVGLARDGRFSLPIIQADLAETCGVTSVHVNRVLRALRERELLTFRNGDVSILNQPRLAALGEFDPAYLYGEHEGWHPSTDKE